MSKGTFITLYGVNNIGKSTHAKLLVERLKQAGHDAVYIKYPIYDLEYSGPKLNALLRSSNKQMVSEEELQTLFRMNRKDYEPTLKKYFKAGKIVVAEDYTGTGIAWGMAKGLSQDFMEELNKNLVREDFSILLTGKRDIRVQEATHIHEQNDELLEKVSKIFIQLGEKYGWRRIELQPKIEDTAELIWKNVADWLEIHLR